MKNILITGIRGFIGFNAIQRWIKTNPEYNYIGLDAETYADRFLIAEKDKWLVEHKIKHYVCDLGNIHNVEWLDELVVSENIDTIIHFSAESHVDNSIKNPSIFFQSNVIGTANILNVAKAHDIRIHVVGTDEVYGETRPEDWTYLLTTGDTIIIPPEEKLIVPSSPYSSSKASADMIALSYHHTYSTKVTVSRCTNNAGKWQMTEKLIPAIISKALLGNKIPVYGDGLQKRHWIDVDDHNDAIMKIAQTGEYGKIYNIGPIQENWITNIELIRFILKYLGKSEDLIEHVTDRLGHDTSYFLPCSFEFKTRSYTEFMPEIIDWYRTTLNTEIAL